MELSEEVKRLKGSEEDHQRTLRALEQAATKMETDKIKQHAEAVGCFCRFHNSVVTYGTQFPS